MKKIITAILLALCMTSCITEGGSETEYGKGLLEKGTNAPDFMIYTEEHPEGFLLSSLRGKQVVLIFWASWCPDCQKETPAIKEMHTLYASDQTEFVGVSFDTDADDWKEYITENGLNWIQHREQKPWKESTLSTAYGIRWIPTIYLIDESGKVDFATVNVADMRSRLAELKAATSSPE